MTAATVLVLAAGRGTRMRSRRPKVLHELCGRALGLWPVQAALQAGAERVIVVDSPERPLAELLPAGVELVVQEQPNGTGGAVLAAAGLLAAGSTVVVLSGDVPLIDAATIGALLAAHRQAGAAATITTTVLADPGGYGRVVRHGDGSLARVVESKRPGDASPAELAIDEINAGIYAFQASALLAALPRLRDDNAQRELYLPQVLDLMSADGLALAAHRIDDPRLLLGVNDQVGLATVRALAQRAINERHMYAGVTIVDPAAPRSMCRSRSPRRSASSPAPGCSAQPSSARALPSARTRP